MVFWKKLFSNSEAVATSETNADRNKELLNSDSNDGDRTENYF